jgi:hypothetical protein
MKPINKTAHQAQKEKATKLRAFICAILKCTDEQYSELVYVEGLKYLKHYLPDDPDGRKMLSRNRVFWNWWKNHFTIRDEEFKKLYERFPIDDTEIVLQLFLQYNDGKQLAENLHPQSEVLEESYCDMIHELLRKEVV